MSDNKNFLGMYPWSKITITSGEGGGMTPTEVQQLIDSTVKDYVKTVDFEPVTQELKDIKIDAEKLTDDFKNHVDHKGGPFDLGHVMSNDEYRGEKMATALIDSFGQIRYEKGTSLEEVEAITTNKLLPYRTAEETDTAMDNKLKGYVSTTTFGVHTMSKASENYGHVKANPAKGDENIAITITPEGYLVGKSESGSTVNLPFYNVADNPNIKNEEGYDNTREIQYVINTLFQRGGGVIFFPEGVYEISCLNMRPKVSIMGAGMGSTVFRCTYPERGFKGIFHFNANCSCATYKDFTIDGNHRPISGIYFAPTGYMGDVGRDEVGHLAERIIADEYGIALLNDNVRIPHKNIFFENMCICYCGDGSEGSMYTNEDTYYGIRLRDDHEQSLLPADDNGYGCYNLDFNHIWIYGCDNGMASFNTDSAFNDSYIECSRWGGWFIGGGNCKFTNIKAIWNGTEYRTEPMADCPAVAINNGTGQHTLCNFELQDNLGGVDFRVQGNNHSITNLVCDANQYDYHTQYKLQVFGMGHYISARLCTYSGARAEYGIAGETNDSIIFITGQRDCADVFDGALGVGEGFVQSYHY